MSCKSINYNGQELKVYSSGVVIGNRGSPLKTRLNTEGYICITAGFPKRTRVKVHRLVAECFIPNPNKLETVNHINKDKTNNTVENLEWMSRENNVKHGLSRPCTAYDPSSGFGLWFPSQAVANECGYQQGNIANCIAGKRKSHKGFIWKSLKEVV